MSLSLKLFVTLKLLILHQEVQDKCDQVSHLTEIIRMLLFSFLSWLHAFWCRSVHFNLALIVSCLQNVYIRSDFFVLFCFWVFLWGG